MRRRLRYLRVDLLHTSRQTRYQMYEVVRVFMSPIIVGVYFVSHTMPIFLGTVVSQSVLCTFLYVLLKQTSAFDNENIKK